jgi:hypothetical protein
MEEKTIKTPRTDKLCRAALDHACGDMPFDDALRLCEELEREVEEGVLVKRGLESAIYRALECAAGNGDRTPTVYNIEQILQNEIRQVPNDVKHARPFIVKDGWFYFDGSNPPSANSHCPDASGSVPDAEALAKRFHETYERLAPQYAYKTQVSSAVDWTEVPRNNKLLMIAVCAEILAENV